MIVKLWDVKPGPAILVSITFGIGWLIPWLLYRNDKNSNGFLHEPVSGVFIVLFLFAAGAVLFTFEVNKILVKHLKWWNGMLFVLHLASGVALAWLASTQGTWTAYVTFGRSQWGKVSNATGTTAAPGFGPDGCQDGGCFVRTVPCLLSEANIEYMVLAFHMLSTLQHLAVVLDWGGHYSDSIRNGKHWMRWFEYAFSASIMFASWSFLCGITDVIALVPLCVSVGTVQMFGYFSDAAARMKQGWASEETVEEDERGQWGCPRCDDFRARVKAYGTFLAKLVLLILAGVLAPIVSIIYVRKIIEQAWENASSAWERAKNIPDTTEFKIVGTVYVALAAVLAWPLCVQGDPELLRDVTVGVLGVHYAFLLVGFVINVCWCNVANVRNNLYPTMQAPFVVLYVLYDVGALVYVLVTWMSNMDSISQASANNCAFIALGSIALCLLKLAPSANGRPTQLNATNDENQELTPPARSTPRQKFIDPIWIFTLAWVPYLLGAWFMTVAVFHDSLQHPGPNAEDPPDALYVIIVTQFLFFSCFAVAQLWYLWSPNKQRYLDTEFYFCLLSLVSKTALAWSLYSGAAGRKELGLRTPGANNTEIPGLSLPWC